MKNNNMIFNGIYTITSKTGAWRTVKIETILADDTQANDSFCNKLAGKRTISLLVGSDNHSDYQMFGFIEQGADKKDRVRLTKKSENSEFFVKLGKMFSSLARGEEKFLRLGCAILCEKTCFICNRKLTTPESIWSGIGPTCASRASRKNGKKTSAKNPTKTSAQPNQVEQKIAQLDSKANDPAMREAAQTLRESIGIKADGWLMDGWSENQI